MSEEPEPEPEPEPTEEPTAADPDPAAFTPKSNYSIAVHTILNDAQKAHGVPHEDYTQYRSYLTRRLARIRHAKPVLKTLTHGPKSKREASAADTSNSTNTTSSSSTTTTTNNSNNPNPKKGGKHSFQPRDEITLEQVTTHENFILDFLYSAERAWAHAMELKSFYKDLISSSKSLSSKSLPSSALKKKKHQTSPGKVRQHYLNRFKKALGHVVELERIGLASGVCDEMTCLELKCYIAWMKGNYYCEVNDWEDACRQYASALTLCFQIAKSTKSMSSTLDLSSMTTEAAATTTTTTEAATNSSLTANATAKSLQLSDFFHSRGTNIIQPLLRYCKYELLQEGKLSKEDVAALCDVDVGQYGDDEDDDVDNEGERENGEADDERVSSILFRGETISIEDTGIKMILIKISNTKGELERMSSSSTRKKKKKVKASVKDAKFMDLLNCYDDAVSIVSKTLKDYEGMVSGPAVNQKRFECTLLLGYFKYAKLQLLMKRNEKMVNELRGGDKEMVIESKRDDTIRQQQEDADSKYKRVEEIAHLYDALLQDAKAVVLLPGGGNVEQGDEVEDEFVLEANANVLRIRALRCYYVGRMYAADAVAKYSEALALFEQALFLASEAAEEIAACQEMEMADELIETMADLRKEINAVQVRTQAASFLASRGSQASSATSGLTLLRRLDDFDSGGKTYRIADVPPALEATPCKPAFFDIANNYVNEFPIDELEFHCNAFKAKG
eukprot:CAMPEP_0203667732 /NCGR_PEP_ID=MMETSP0090-20130426/4513_1 /ASSEMBLY_ACC=CAM_ASM_001088 /TAXON_ID=426623 /ORGANISM="Chaetoceros affinis, Strain CCMP159" /LENGTH=732 /DNA_ID=CAMNT_0050531985 /DNA_START=34 /DNA_END=2229 /DNA_ORIENTATION=-